jgi:phosphotransferase system enzyme I (PtsI)
VGHCRLANDHVLVGEELSASLPIETDRYTVGYIVEKGGPTSHAVILARALQRPAVGNILQVSTVIPLAAKVLINGDTGEVIINPSAATLARYRPALAGAGQGTPVSDPVPGLKVMANIERSTDVHEVLAARAEGIGLYRTEMELLVEGRLLSETEQAARYADVVRAMAGKPVYIRLLDFGADKAATCLDLSPQGDFRPGLRGAELLLACPELLHTQARALARASRHGPIHVLYPMIVGVNQFRELRARFDEAVADLQSSGLRHGVLFEVPSACLQAQRILGLADFGCIGTNDLIQYLFAADRTNGVLSSDTCLETESVLWRIIQGLSRAATAAGKPMAICGELAGNPDLTRRVIQAGISAVSTSPSRIADVRRAARRATTH